jgi:phosphatidate cytidylyltransferase
MSLKGKNLGVRTLSGAILGIVVVGSVLWGPWPAAVVFTLVAVGAITELMDMASKRLPESSANYFLTIALAGGWVSGVALNPDPLMLLVGLLFVPVIFLAEVFRKSNHTIENGALSSLAMLYVALPMALLMLIGGGTGEWEPARVLAIIFIVWVNDIFAYLVGCSIGKHKMCPAISPKKSWEGLFGGLLFAVAFAMAAGYMMMGNIYLWGGLGLVVALAGVVGDLLESKIKRECGVKDSGNLIPGHGGMLDRFDALLIAAPVAYVYMMIFGL